MNTKLEVTENRRSLHIGSVFVDLNESEYQELIKIFSDQQTEQLKKDLEEKDKEIEKLKESFAVVNGISNTLQFELESNKEFYESRLSEKEKELSELKAKHEKDVKKAWQKGSESWIRGAQTAEQYYTQTHGQ